MKSIIKNVLCAAIICALFASVALTSNAAKVYVNDDFESYEVGSTFTMGNSDFVGEIAEKNGNKYLKMAVPDSSAVGHYSWWYPGDDIVAASAGKICFKADITRGDWLSKFRIYGEDKSAETPKDLMFIDIDDGQGASQWFRYGYSPAAGSIAVAPDDANPAEAILLEPGNTYRMEFYIDMDAHTVDTYIDGTHIGHFDNFVQTRIDYIRIHVQSGNNSEWDIDNLYFGPYDQLPAEQSGNDPDEPSVQTSDILGIAAVIVAASAAVVFTVIGKKKS